MPDGADDGTAFYTQRPGAQKRSEAGEPRSIACGEVRRGVSIQPLAREWKASSIL
jgi:hypothetical protein